jgi:hypothetical protein
LIVGLLLLALVLLLENFVLFFGLGSVSLNNIVVIVGSLELGLHFGKLMLHAIKLYTGIFSLLLDLSYLLFFFSELEIDTFVLVGQLLGESILETGHQRL